MKTLERICNEARVSNLAKWACGVLVASYVCLFVGCSRSERTERQNIEAIFMNEASRFTVFIHSGKELQTKVLFVISVSGNRGELKIFDDVPESESMWYEGRWITVNGCYEGYDRINIHIHNHKDINPSGWNHGKFGSGTTSSLEDK